MINFKLRLKNKVTLTALISLIVGCVFQILQIFEITPKIAQSEVVNFATLLINILAAFGVLVDPTTKGISDSEQALKYEELN